MSIIICDIDGTIADLGHRLHHIQKKPKDWDSFHAGVIHDSVIWPIKAILEKFEAHDIVYVSGRPERNRAATIQWLDSTGCPDPSALYMRAEGDFRDDQIVKAEIYEKHLKGRDILFVLDDRTRVVKMRREKGLTCLQVRDGDY